MRCPSCNYEKQVAEVKAGDDNRDWLLACWQCPWQVIRRKYAEWKARWM